MTETTPPTINDLFGGSELDPLPNPHPVWSRLRRETPILYVKGMIYEFYLVTSAELAHEVMANDTVFSNAVYAEGVGMVLGKTILEMDGKAHLDHRKLASPFLSPSALRGKFEVAANKIANDLIDEFVDKGEADLISDFTFTYPLRVFTTILDLPIDDYEQVHQWAIDLCRVVSDPFLGMDSGAKFAAYLAPVVAERRGGSGTDLITMLCNSEVDGEQLSDEAVVNFLRLMILAGAETTYHLLGSVMFGLLKNRDQFDAVLADEKLVRSAIDEGLRWEAPVQIVSRVVTQSFELGGVQLKEGDKIHVSLGSANRDEKRYPDPDRFDIYRNNEPAHEAFGHGRHFCMGSRVAYSESQIAISTLLKRLPNLRLKEGEECGIFGFSFRSPDRLPVQFG
ncbi:MAG: cytochrome P450 [Polyangiaceae bacterium]|nr:cytochrome P450 [Polyangiaceae bacterium]